VLQYALQCVLQCALQCERRGGGMCACETENPCGSGPCFHPAAVCSRVCVVAVYSSACCSVRGGGEGCVCA